MAHSSHRRVVQQIIFSNEMKLTIPPKRILFSKIKWVVSSTLRTCLKDKRYSAFPASWDLECHCPNSYQVSLFHWYYGVRYEICPALRTLEVSNLIRSTQLLYMFSLAVNITWRVCGLGKDGQKLIPKTRIAVCSPIFFQVTIAAAGGS